MSPTFAWHQQTPFRRSRNQAPLDMVHKWSLHCEAMYFYYDEGLKNKGRHTASLDVKQDQIRYQPRLKLIAKNRIVQITKLFNTINDTRKSKEYWLQLKLMQYHENHIEGKYSDYGLIRMISHALKLFRRKYIHTSDQRVK